MAVDVVPLSPPPKRKGGGLFLTDGRQCVATGNGLNGGEAGVSQIVSVRCRDSRNEPMTKGGDVVLVSITPEGGGTIDAHVVDNTDGSYTCTYMPTVASSACKVKVTVNGTHVVGSPFPATVAPGRTEARASEVYGHGLNDGVAGQPNFFTIQTKDPFGNRCVASAEEGEKDEFVVLVKPLHALLPEYDTFLRKYEVSPVLTDNEDGTHGVEYSVEYAGFYSITVTFGNVPVGDSPYTACIYNSTIAFPPTLSFEALPGDPSSLPAEMRSCDIVQVHDLLVELKSLPITMTRNRREREFIHYFRLKSAMARGKDEWLTLTMRGAMLPPPYRRVCTCIDQKLLLFGHSDEGSEGGRGYSPLDTLRVLDLSDLSAKMQWEGMTLQNKPPNAVEGYALCIYGGKFSAVISGGLGADGMPLADIFLLTLGASMADGAVATYRTLAEWPASIFSGEGFSARAFHSMAARDGTAQFWVFGGRGGGGTGPDDPPMLLNDLSVFDLQDESFSTPSVVESEPPTPREHHASAFIADRYLVISGGYDASGAVLDDVCYYDTYTGIWHTIAGVVPRARHRLVNRGGVLYILGGVGGDGLPAPPVPLQAYVHPFPQNCMLDFVGNNAQAMLVKTTPTMAELRNKFTVEAIFYARSFANNPYNPIVVKTDNGLKTGFGLVGQEHPAYKGDAEEGPWIHFFVGAFTTSDVSTCKVRIETDQWLHVVGTFDGARLVLYVNGREKHAVEFAVSDDEAETLHSKNDLSVGGMVGKYAFDGMIDEVRLWECARPEDKIDEFMNSPVCKPRDAEGLLGQWTFNEGIGEQCIDTSFGAPNHGSFDRYAGGVEMRRLQSRRPKLEKELSEREKAINEMFNKLQKWKDEFQARNGKEPTKADLLLADQEITAIARRLGEFGADA